MTVGIYGWFDRENDQCLYIGQSSNIESRKLSHKKLLKDGKHPRQDFAEYYKNKENKDDIYLEILEVTENDLDIKNGAEIKWFNLLKPLFYGMEPDKNYYCFTPTEEARKLSAKTLSKSREKDSYLCIQCNINNTFRKDGICISCKDKNNQDIIEKKRKYNLDNNVKYEDIDIIEMYIAKEMSYREISLVTGISYTQVGKIIKRNFIVPRGHGAQSKSRFNGLKEKTIKICLYCGKEFSAQHKRKFCSRECTDKCKQEEGYKQREKSKTTNSYALIPESVKNNYRRHLDTETIRRSLPIHGKYHYGKDLYDYHCPICKIDFPDINHEDSQWKTQEYIANCLGITKNQLGGFLLRKGYKNDKGKVTALARKPSDLYAILEKKNVYNSALWDINKVTKLYNSGN